MIKKNIIYTKLEFKKLLKSENKYFIGEYYLNSKGTFADYYIALGSKLNKEQNELLDNDKLEFFSLVKFDKLSSIEDQAFDRVWYDRNNMELINKLNSKEKKTVLDNIKRIKNKYKIDDSKINDFYHGYWSGILALTRYLKSNMFDEKDLTEITNGILDT